MRRSPIDHERMTLTSDHHHGGEVKSKMSYLEEIYA
jgi:hypothetical protein